MSFSRPSWLVASLLLCALFVIAYRWAERRSNAQALAYSNLDFVIGALRAPRLPLSGLMLATSAGILALAFAAGGPRFTTTVPVKDATVVLCIDTSGSMRARDLTPSRWSAARTAAGAFIDAVPNGTRVGIVSFSSGAQVVAAPTADLDAVRDSLARVPAPNGATAIGDALETAAAQLPDKGARAIVLLTDGVNNRGADPFESSKTIGSRGVRIWTIGIGTSGSGEIIPGTSELADLDEASLQAVAKNGGGRYAQVADAATLVETFKQLAFETVWQRKRLDGSLPFAIGGGGMLALAFLAGLGLGRLP